MGTLSVLTIIFAIAKLLGFIAWSWWLVFTPLLIEAAIGIVLWVVALVAIWTD